MQPAKRASMWQSRIIPMNTRLNRILSVADVSFATKLAILSACLSTARQLENPIFAKYWIEKYGNITSDELIDLVKEIPENK